MDLYPHPRLFSHHAPRPHPFSRLERRQKSMLPNAPFWAPALKMRSKCPVDNTIGELRAIFHSDGRNGPYNDMFANGNPATIKDYLHSITKNIQQYTWAPSRPFHRFSTNCPNSFVTSSSKLSLQTPPTQRYIFAQDAAFFCVDFFSGDRGSDKINSDQRSALPPSRSRLPFQASHWENFARQRHMFRCQSFWYFILCESMALNTYRTTPGMAEGKKMHSLRSSCSITLSMMGASMEEIEMHIGWTFAQNT